MGKMKYGTKLIILLLVLMVFTVPVVQADAPSLGFPAAGKKVWFGNNTLWRILHTGEGEAMLISDQILDSIPFKSNDNMNQWQGSDAQAWCMAYYGNWTDGPEKAAILPTTISETNDKTTPDGTPYFYQGGYWSRHFGAASLIDEYFFFLSAKEADELFSDNNDRIAVGAGYWWLRSPRANAMAYNSAGDVDYSGWVVDAFVYNQYGARPAFNLNLSSVIFSSQIPQFENQYKLTLLDEDLEISLISGGNPSLRGNELSVSYELSGVHAGSETKAMILITDDAYNAVGAQVLQYGILSASDPFELDPALDLADWGSAYHVYLTAVNENGGNTSDYAAEPVELFPDIYYNVEWQNWDGTVLESGEEKGGNTPSYNGETPEHPAVGEVSYVFAGWDPEPAPITEDTIYTAVYEEVRSEHKVTVSTDGNGTASASPESGPEGTEVTLTAVPDEGYEFSEWQVISGGVNIANDKFTIGDSDVEIKALFKAAETKPYQLNVDIFHIRKEDGSRGIPAEVNASSASVLIRVRRNGFESRSKEKLSLSLAPGKNKESLSVEFTEEIPDPVPGLYEVLVEGLPKSVEGKRQLHGAEPDPLTFNITWKAQLNKKGGITVYIYWEEKDQWEPEIIAVYPLPEDEIGSYVLHKDGTKEYLVFQTYAICMDYLGSHDLCKGFERCYHK